MLKNVSLALALAVTSVAATATTAISGEYWVRFGVETYTRWGPGKFYPRENMIYGGTKVTLIKQSGAWSKVYVNGMRCWVRTSALTPWGYDYSMYPKH